MRQGYADARLPARPADDLGLFRTEGGDTAPTFPLLRRLTRASCIEPQRRKGWCAEPTEPGNVLGMFFQTPIYE